MNLFNLVGVAVAMLSALLAVIFVHPGIVRFAINRRIVDNPDARKLQRNPVPVMGGVAVFVGLVVGLCALEFYNVVAPGFVSMTEGGAPIVPLDVVPLLPLLMGMSIMLVVGVTDDVSGLSPRVRFAIEIAVALMLMLWSDKLLNDFQGLWHIEVLPTWFAVPLTIVAIVGIINAINLVDGVDGLSSGFCIMASLAFAVLFSYSGNILMLLLCALTIGSLLPFFFHNVFGQKSKMFIGDGGSLMMGAAMSAYVVMVAVDGGDGEMFVDKGFGVVAFTLAVMCVPVFDALRVMVMRIVRGISPFSPDKTHLHHLFIELGFSHFGTTLSELLLNTLVIAVWFVSYKMGASIDAQFYIVVGVGLLLTAGFYKLMKIQQARNTALLRVMQRIGKATHFEECKGWKKLQQIVDYK